VRVDHTQRGRLGGKSCATNRDVALPRLGLQPLDRVVSVTLTPLPRCGCTPTPLPTATRPQRKSLASCCSGHPANRTKLASCRPVKRIEKPWGYELHWVRADALYMGKIIHINAGARLSLQVHDEKQESWLLFGGRAAVLWEDQTGKLVETELLPGNGYSTRVGQKHRLIGLTDCDIVEVSTPEKGTTCPAVFRRDMVAVEPKLVEHTERRCVPAVYRRPEPGPPGCDRGVEHGTGCLSRVTASVRALKKLIGDLGLVDGRAADDESAISDEVAFNPAFNRKQRDAGQCRRGELDRDAFPDVLHGGHAIGGVLPALLRTSTFLPMYHLGGCA
jgi:mannose-6-phosphate isomerase